VDYDLSALPQRLFGADTAQPGYLASRWLFLRGLGLIFFSAFYSLAFQIRGLIGPRGSSRGELPRRGGAHIWNAALLVRPSVFWWSASDRALLTVCILGMLASFLLAMNICPRGMLVVGLIAFLSFISTAREFASYQSDGMLLEAGFISLFWRRQAGARVSESWTRLREPAGFC